MVDDSEPVVPPTRAMRRDQGILVERVFQYGINKYAKTRNPDNISVETYRSMLLDPQIRAAFDVLVLATIGNGWEFNHKEENNAEQVEFIQRAMANVNRMEGKHGSLFEVFRDVLSALWAGFSVTEKVWGQNGDNKWVIKRYKTLPPETIEFNVDRQGRLKKNEAVKQNPRARDSIKLPARKINIFTVNSDFGNPYGQSLFKAIHRTWYVKDWLVKFYSMFLENMGSPFWVGKTNRDTAEMNAALQDAKQSAVITLGEGEEVNIIETNNSGDAFLQAIRYQDAQIMRGLLVPSLLTGQDEAYGSRALSEVQLEMFKLSRIGALQKQLEAWINGDIREMIRLNYGPQDDYPTIVFRSWSRSDMVKMSRMITELVQGGIIAPNEAWIRQFLELPDADDNYDPKAFPPGSGSYMPPQPGDRRVEPEAREPGDGAEVVRQEDDDMELISAGIRDSLRKKVNDHNKKYSDPKKRTTLGKIVKVYNRGLGAYKTNPPKDRPNVTGGNQWAMGRVNSFLRALRSGRFKSGKHDTDLLPSGHPAKGEKKENEEVTKDTFTTREEAMKRAKEIGCDTVHSHETDNGTVYMPCKTHDEYRDKVGDMDDHDDDEDEDYEKKKKYYELETYKPPSGAASNARKALRWKKEHGSEVKGMTSVGWARARQLASGVKVSRRTVARMAAFNRHRKNAKINPEYKSTPWKDNGYVAWLGWGGTTGINWAMSKMKAIRNKGLEDFYPDEELYDDLTEEWFGEEAYEDTFAENGFSEYEEALRASSNMTYQKNNPSPTEGTRVTNILDLKQSNFPVSPVEAYDDRAHPGLLAILKRGGKALTKTEVSLLNTREHMLSMSESEFKWLGEINGTD